MNLMDSSNTGTARAVTTARWVVYLLIGVWLRLAAGLVFYIAGLALLLALPLALLQRLAIIAPILSISVMGENWLMQQSDPVYFGIAILLSLIGALLLRVGIRQRRWLFSHPGRINQAG